MAYSGRQLLQQVQPGFEKRRKGNKHGVLRVVFLRSGRGVSWQLIWCSRFRVYSLLFCTRADQTKTPHLALAIGVYSWDLHGAGRTDWRFRSASASGGRKERGL